MANYFTQYWRNDTWRRQAETDENTPLDHVAGNEFRKRGVRENDYIYVVTNVDGKMYVAGRMVVDRLVSHAEAERHRGRGLWKASQHILGRNGTTLRFNRRVPDKIVRKLRFGDGDGIPLITSAPGILHTQTLRGVRRLTRQSAALLDSLLGDGIDWAEEPDEVAQPERFFEGATRQVSVNVYERDRRARSACIKHHGTRCLVCGFDFAERYGDIGEGFIQVHHLRQLSDIGETYEVDAQRDLIPVCPNCHVMLHRETPCLSVKELRSRLRPATTPPKTDI